jgi:hypothetical protein
MALRLFFAVWIVVVGTAVATDGDRPHEHSESPCRPVSAVQRDQLPPSAREHACLAR